MSTIRCKVPDGTKRDDFWDFPGSDDAVEKGCTCPLDQPWPTCVEFSSDCPIHELQRVAS